MIINPFAFGGGGAAPFDPLSIAWDHAYWTEGAEFVALGLADAAAVGTWPDEVATSDLAQATAGNKPTYRASSASLGSRPVVEFDGVSDYMQVDFTDLTQPNEYVIVARLRSVPGASANALLTDGFNGTGRHLLGYVGASGAWRIFAGTSLDGGTADLVKHLFRGEFNTTSSKLFVDEVQQGSTGDAGSHACSGLTLGANNAGATPGAYDVAFVGISTSLLTAQNRTDLHSWAQSLYGTA